MPDATSDLMDRLRASEGAKIGEPRPGRDPVNQPMIRHWCDAIGDRNPAYTDLEFAEGSVHGGIVAPPTMLQAWIMPGLVRPAGGSSASSEVFRLLDEAGFTSVVATNCTQEYTRYLRPGDEVSVSTSIESVSDEKRTALGVGHFVTQRMTFRDASGEIVATMQFRMLKFRPPEKQPAMESRAAQRPRPIPSMTRDTEFFWKGVEQCRLLIQRCAECKRLRHPPGPMCPTCHSLEWDTVEASGRGTVYSHVVAHHPPVPPFEYPNVIALVELEEGTRLVSNLVGVEPDEVRAGMAVELEFTEVEENRFLPLFRPARAEGS